MQAILDAPRPVWLDVAIAFGLGIVGETLVLIGLIGPSGRSPLTDLILPAGIGLVGGVATRRQLGIIGLVVGVVSAFQLSPQLGRPAFSDDQVSAVLAAGSAVFGFVVVSSLRMSREMSFVPKPPSPEDQARVAAQLGAQLRVIDPNAPGAFEHATVLLHRVNEQIQFTGPMGPWSVGPDQKPPEQPTELLRIQAELVETARVAALAAGARRVTITASGMGGINVQAVFGDPIVAGEVLPDDGEPRPLD